MTLLRAAKIRDHKQILELSEDLPAGEIADVKYHRTCRSIFTMKKDLDRLMTKQNIDQNADNEDDVEKTCNSRRKQGLTSRVYEPECMICQKTKYLPGQRTREPLVKCCEFRADVKIRQAAEDKMDFRMISLVSRDLIAAEGQYHRSCYRAYTRNTESCEAGNDDNAEGSMRQDSYESALYTANQELFQFIRNDLFTNPRVMRMTDLSSRLVESMKSLGIEHIKDATKKHLRRCLENEFGNALHFLSDGNSRLLVYPDNLSRCDLVKANQDLEKELRTLKTHLNKDVVAKAALLLRDDIRKHDRPQAWPPVITEEDQSRDIIPASVVKFLCYLLTGGVNYADVSQKVERLVTSFGYDLVYAVSQGKVKTPKHITLAFSVKSLTGNVELVQLLNRLGHSVSYTQMEEISTALCLQKLSNTDGDVPLPSTLRNQAFTTLAWDNIDRLEETVSGGGTSHRVNGIAVQTKMTESTEVKPLPSVPKTKRRSIDVPQPTLPTYNVGQREGPEPCPAIDLEADDITHTAWLKNMIWILARTLQQKEQSISSWTGFNIKSRSDVQVIRDNVCYLPTINAPATQMSTVHEILRQSLVIKDHLQLKKIVCVFDQALYAKATEIMWKHKETFEPIIIRMGTFHTSCTLLAIMGKRFQDAGLRDIAIESGVIAEGSVSGVMDGRRYNRAVRFHKLMYEALLRLAWSGFLSWIHHNHTENVADLEEAMEAINTLSDDVSQQALQGILQSTTHTRIMCLFDEYVTTLRSGNSRLTQYWMTYIDLVEILLGLLRATREGDWLLHLVSIRQLIPWCFSYDRVNYARYLSYYYAQMSRLQTQHPDVYAEFMRGRFSVQLGPRNPFGRIPVDQTIEETVNKDTQTAGGTKGFSLNHSAISKYYLTAEHRSFYLKQLRDMTSGAMSAKFCHKDLQGTRIRRDEADVKSLVDLMENNWINPMSPEEPDLVSLSTGNVAPPEIVKDISEAHQMGEDAYLSFRTNRLEQDPPEEKFHNKLTKLKLKTFSDVSTKKMKARGNTKEIILQADRNLFRQIILISESRQLRIQDVLAHPLGPLPWPLANPDGTLRKTNKASLARELESRVLPAEEIPAPSTCLIDGMSIIQKINGNGITFTGIANATMAMVLKEGLNSHRIDVVFDVYRDQSIKNAERCKRGSSTALQYKTITGGHKVTQWRKFLCSSTNKSSLIKFVVEAWKQPSYREKLGSKALYATIEDTCFRLTKYEVAEVEELHCSHEEADTRLLLHANHAAKSSKAVIISAEDTDVLVIALSNTKQIPCRVYQKTRRGLVDVDNLAQTIGEGVCRALPALHAFTGCDTVSAFAGRGKLGALKLVSKNEEHRNAFQQLGESWMVSPDSELFDKIQRFTCEMYVPSTPVTDVNEMRHHLFLAKKGNVESSALPPCQTSLHLHVQRANYQAGVWRRCLQNHPRVPSPVESGWEMDEDDNISITWLQSPPAPAAVLELLTCNCSRSCTLPTCTCLANGLRCTNMCKLKDCCNRKR
ncbi:hypothetical protein Bbelb_017190 [Branchiostoma belcheri]|nr:hypothetical protein Bbelb_017190 [Branchiostoma belcheri]